MGACAADARWHARGRRLARCLLARCLLARCLLSRCLLSLFTLASFYSRVPIGPLSGFCKLTAHLGHKLAHGGDITWRAAFDPGFVALRSFFQVREELFIHKPLPSLRNDGLDAFPDPEKFATSLKE